MIGVKALAVSYLASLVAYNYIRPQYSIAVLMYHNVTDDLPPSYRSIRIDDFRHQMKYLKDKCDVLSIQDLIKTYNSPRKFKRARKSQVVITFDDGFRDNYTNAFPILKELSLPAACFIVPQWISKSNTQSPNREFLNDKEMKEMHNHGISFCSHTLSHPMLPHLDYKQQKAEILKGRQELYERINDPVVMDAFAYPYGEYNETTLEILKELKFKIGLTVWHHLNGPQENPLRLKRLTADGRDDIVKFASQINPLGFKVYEKIAAITSRTSPRAFPQLIKIIRRLF